MDWTSESEDNNEFKWDTDEDRDVGVSAQDPLGVSQPLASEADHAGSVSGIASRNCEAGSSRPQLVCDFVGMGFSEEMVVKAIKDNGEMDKEAILETLLTYSAIEKSSPAPKQPPSDLSASDKDFTDDDPSSMDSSDEEYIAEDIPPNEKTLLTLVEMGFTADEASSAIERCGHTASILELADSIHAAQISEAFDVNEEYKEDKPRSNIVYYSHKDKKLWAEAYDPSNGKKRRWIEEYESSKERKKKLSAHEVKIKRTPCQGKMKSSFKSVFEDEGDEASCSLPNPMVGFGLPSDPWCVSHRKLPEAAIGPPYFYYENVAFAPKGVWATISRFLYDVEPEFVDSKHFCAAARKRGYIHNLPIQNRFLLQPLPPRTIHEALPMTKKWWPEWDPRTHLNCLQTCIASAKLTERIRSALAKSDDPPHPRVQQMILKECRKWNLVWVGVNKVAPLEPDEIEALLGFPKDHTRGGGISRTERYRSLGNSFQVDTVAYHLSVLKEMFPHGMTVLSLFSGIGGAEVALHRLGIHLKTVVSVEISEINRNIVQSWWEQTGQTGTLVHIADVQQLTSERLEKMINTYGGFDLVIGGSPCNNLAGSNRVARDGLQGEHSSLFYDYVRILDLVKNIMGRNM